MYHIIKKSFQERASDIPGFSFYVIGLDYLIPATLGKVKEAPKRAPVGGPQIYC